MPAARRWQRDRSSLLGWKRLQFAKLPLGHIFRIGYVDDFENIVYSMVIFQFRSRQFYQLCDGY